MSSITKLSLGLAALTFFAAAAQAQTAPWNRRVSDVHIVHPPGTPPGTWRVQATISFGADDSVAPHTDLGTDITLELNGTPIEVTTLPVSTDQVIACYAAGQCTIASPCTYFDLGAGTQSPGLCDNRPEFHNGVWLSNCRCWTNWIWISLDWPFNSSDQITVQVHPTAGSQTEYVTSDDSITVPVGENNPGVSYCAGDGTLATACPCGNFGAAGRGCASSANPSGALLAATGFTEVDPLTGTDAVVLHGSGMPATATAIYLKGSSSNPNGVVFGDGVRCVAGTLIRMATKPSVGGSSQFPEAGDPSVSVRGGTPSGSGLTGSYQVYYRNPPDFCTPATFNVSNGVQILW